MPGILLPCAPAVGRTHTLRPRIPVELAALYGPQIQFRRLLNSRPF
jgi:hypothetical protein